MASNSSPDISDVLDGILRQMAQLPSLVGGLDKTLTRLASSLLPVVGAIGNLFSGAPTKVAAPQQPVNNNAALITALNQNTAAVTSMGRMLAHMFTRIMGAGGGGAGGGRPRALPAAGGWTPPASSSPGNATAGNASAIPIAPVASAMSKLVAVAGIAAAAIGAMAVAAAVAEHTFQKMEQYVKLFNPGVIQMFHTALDNLGATIGRGFVSVFQDATQVVQRFTTILVPIIAEMAPMVKQFADVFSNIVVKYMTVWGNLIKATLPSLAQLMELFATLAEIGLTLYTAISQLVRGMLLIARLFYELSGMGTVVRLVGKLFEALNIILQPLEAALSIFETVLTTVIDTVMAFVSSFFPVKSIMNGLAYAVQLVIRNMYILAVQMAKLAGLTSVVDALIASVEGKTKAGDTAAQSPQIKSLEQLSKDLALAAASAGAVGGQGGVANQQQFWKQTLDEMRAAKDNGVSVKTLLEAILDAIRHPFGGGKNAQPAPPPNGAAPGPGGIPGGAIGSVVGGLLGGPLGAVAGGWLGGRR